ncbi:MAG: DUF2062 domain-containing protein [Nitrospirae bacterium]|nr:DUF2062 domain-containing protein [Nitrospirota bacterium]
MIASVREKLRAVLTLGETPHQLGVAFGVGVFIALSPLIGLHIVLAAASAWAFRLNPVALFVGVLVNNPWTMVPLYAACLWLGTAIWPTDAVWSDIAWQGLTLVDFLSQFRPYLMPFVVGTTVAGAACGLLGYVVMKAVVTAYRRQRGRG